MTWPRRTASVAACSKVLLTGAARVDAALEAARRAAVEALWAHVFGEKWGC